MESNTKIFLKMVLLIALPIGALSFLVGSVLPKQIGMETEARHSLMFWTNMFAGVLNPVLGTLYMVKRIRRRDVAEQEGTDVS